jgi:PAS domain S-box-containing protein
MQNRSASRPESTGDDSGSYCRSRARTRRALWWILAGLATSIALLPLLAVAQYRSVVRLIRTDDERRSTIAFRGALQQMQRALVDIKAGERGFVLTGDERFLVGHDSGRADYQQVYRTLRERVTDEGERHEQWVQLGAAAEEMLAFMEQVVTVRRAEGRAAAEKLVQTGKGKQLADAVAERIAALDAEAATQMEAADRRVAIEGGTTKELVLAGSVGAVLLLLVAAAAAWLQSRWRLQAEENLEQRLRELRAAEARVRTLLDSTAEAIYGIDRDGRCTFANPSCARMLGYDSPTELVGQQMHERIHHTRPDGSPYPNDECKICRAYRRGVRVHVDDEVLWRKDGTCFPAEYWSFPLVRGETVEGCVVTFLDITERKRVLEQVRELNDQLEQRVLHRTADLNQQLARMKLINQITRAITDRQDLESLYRVVTAHIERDLPADYVSISRFDEGSATFSRIVRGPKSAEIAEAVGLTQLAQQSVDPDELAEYRGGRSVYLPDAVQSSTIGVQRLAGAGLGSMVVTPIVAKGTLQGVLAVARQGRDALGGDERAFLEQLAEHVALAVHQLSLYRELQDAYETLRRSQEATVQTERLRAIGQLASGVAHDINNALSPAVILADQVLQKEQGLSQKGRKYLEIIQRALEDVAQTVRRMREFYKQRGERIVLAPVRLNDLVTHVVELTRARWRDEAQGRGATIKLVTELDADLPQINGNETELRDAMTNLIFNAVDAMPQGGVLTVRTHAGCLADEASDRAGAPPTHVVLAVSDTGVGMDEPTRRRCLEPFFTTKGERGSGLGLAMVYGTARRHSARIEIDSSPGAGTSVRLVFALPRVLQAAATAVPASRPGRPLRILLVDDERLIRETMQAALEELGHEIVASPTGTAAIEAFDTARGNGTSFDVVITDLGMPDVDGRAVAKAIKERSVTTPVILLTGWGQHLQEEQTVPPHVDRLLKKPARLDEVCAALADLISNS